MTTNSSGLWLSPKSKNSDHMVFLLPYPQMKKLNSKIIREFKDNSGREITYTKILDSELLITSTEHEPPAIFIIEGLPWTDVIGTEAVNSLGL